MCLIITKTPLPSKSVWGWADGWIRTTDQGLMRFLVSLKMCESECNNVRGYAKWRSHFAYPLLCDAFFGISVDHPGWPLRSRRCKSSFTAGVGADFNATSRKRFAVLVFPQR